MKLTLFRHWGIRTKIISIAVISITLMLGFALCYLLPKMENDVMAERKTAIRHLVEVGGGILAQYEAKAKVGEMPVEEAQKRAMAAIKDLRYNGKEYFWINDTVPKMVMHPIKPELDGKELSDFKDMKGKLLFVEFVKVCREKGGGFVDYLWPKPGGSEPVPKISYVLSFAPWNWVIGTGIYVDDVAAEIKDLQWFVIGGTLLLAVVMLALAISVGTRIVKPIRNMNATLATGDLSVRIEGITTRDEVGELACNMNKIIQTFHDVIGRVLVSSSNVVLAVDVIRDTSRKTAEDATQQSEQSSRIATSAEEMTQTINSIARNAIEASGSSETAMSIATRGQEDADGAVAQVREVHSSTSELAAVIDRLNNSATEIGDIITVINDIADQTNLLALNAAIEAARAGEHGRGFAVVADEVRGLAERTIKATAEITKKIDTVQNETRQTRRTMEEAADEVTRASESIGHVGAALNQIVAATQTVHDQIIQIASAVEQQSTTSEEVARSTDQISAIAKETEASTDKLMHEVGRLTDISDELRNATSSFKVDDAGFAILDVAKSDHRIFVGKIASCLRNETKLDPTQLADHHTCRFGKWYFSDGQKKCGQLPSYRAIDVPHERIHALAKKAVSAYNTGNRKQAEEFYNQAETVSHEILNLLDRLKDECARHH